MSIFKYAVALAATALFAYRVYKQPREKISISTGGIVSDREVKNTRRGTRGRLRRIRRARGMFTNLTIEADNLTELGMRSDKSLMEVKRRLRQIASSAGLEIYNEDMSCEKIKPEDLTAAQVEHAVASAIDLIMDREHLEEREQEFNSRHEVMVRSRAIAISGRVLGPVERLFLTFTIWWSRMTGLPLQRTVE